MIEYYFKLLSQHSLERTKETHDNTDSLSLSEHYVKYVGEGSYESISGGKI